jgi:benzoyl-CoA reductase/2-hydroxyglutaryl-CoA dehydratase subunit BcrC/BadD/HgdB
MRTVGMTTTVPVEVLLAAGVRPLDLNNRFITDPDAAGLVRQAELAGYPRTACAWIKGLYAVLKQGVCDAVVVVTEGDCSQTHAMMETLRDTGLPMIPFSFPYDRDAQRLQREIEKLLAAFGATWEAAERVREELAPLRRKVRLLDDLTWQKGTVSGAENHLIQVSCSDFDGDPVAFEAGVDRLLAEAQERLEREWPLRLGYLGVPPIYGDLYEFVESRGAGVVYNEIQRQFTMVDSLECDLLGQYLNYTYPYDVFGRLEDICRQVQLRRLDGVIHYVQGFCFRQIQDMLVREQVPCPVLTLEGDTPGPLDARNRLRLEAFLETLAGRQAAPEL